jgi:hypothetical protein
MKKQTEKKSNKKIIIRVIGIILIMVGLLLYGRFVSTTGLVIKEYKITNSNLPDTYHGLKIIHISDIHYGQTIHSKEFNNMVEKINIIEPDIVVLTGDLFDRDVTLDNKQIDDLTKGLTKIKAKIGKYAIIGNHDFNHTEWEEVITNGEFINLNDNYDLIYSDGYEPILISGMSTNLHGAKSVKDKLEVVDEFLNNTNDDENEETEEQNEKNDSIINIQPDYKIMIMHEPDFIRDFDYSKYDLILAGHSHNGQVRIPFIGAVFLPEGAKKYYNEHYDLGNTDLFISSGTGTSTMKFRFFNRPSINFYRLTNK